MSRSFLNSQIMVFIKKKKRISGYRSAIPTVGTRKFEGRCNGWVKFEIRKILFYKKETNRWHGQRRAGHLV